jgi:hypothetical protein
MSDFSDEDIDDLIERMRSQVEAERARTIEHKATIAIGSRVGEAGGREEPAPLGDASEGRGGDAASNHPAGQSEAEAMRQVEKPKGKVVSWIRRIIVRPEPSTEPPWKGQQIDPEAVAAREAPLEPAPMDGGTYFWISIKHAAKDGSHAGEIREGLFHEVDGLVVVTSRDGKERYGSSPNTGDPLKAAREFFGNITTAPRRAGDRRGFGADARLGSE